MSLRPLRVADAGEMVDVLADPGLYRFTGGEPPTRDDLERRYGRQVLGRSPDGTERWVNLIVLFEHRPVGYVQATIPEDGSPTEVAWVVGAPWQGRGVATRAVGLLLAQLAQQGVRQVVAHIHPDHVASQAVARRVGLSPTDLLVDGETQWVGSLD